MATTKQKAAARRNLEKARRVQSRRAHGEKVPRQTKGLSTAEQNELPDSKFAFPKQRKEPLTDARHVRNAVARFDQAEGVSDSDRDRAWRRIRAAARRYDVEIEARGWRQLFEGGKARNRGQRRTTGRRVTPGVGGTDQALRNDGDGLPRSRASDLKFPAS